MTSLALASPKLAADEAALLRPGDQPLVTSAAPVKKSAASLRILHLFNRYRHFGGEEAAVLRMSEAMRAGGAQVDECFFSSSDWEQPGAPPRWQQALRSLYNPAALRTVREAHRTAGSNLWLAHNILPVLSPGVLREARRQRMPIALYLHNYRPFSVSGSLWANGKIARGGLRENFLHEIATGAWQGSRPRTAFMAAVLLAAHALGWYRRVDAWIAVSQFVRDRFIEAGIPREKIHVLAYPFEPREQPLGIEPQPQFLFLGRLTEAKGVRVLLRAWETVRSQLAASNTGILPVRSAGVSPAACTVPKLIIAGEGELQSEVQTAAAASNGAIEYRGNVSGEAKEKLIAESLALIVPSLWWDPYPTVVYEAFDHSRPVLAARSGGLPESVSPGDRGLLHEPGNAEALAAHIIKLHRDPAIAAKMGAAGRKWLVVNSGIEFWWRGFDQIAATIIHC